MTTQNRQLLGAADRINAIIAEARAAGFKAAKDKALRAIQLQRGTVTIDATYKAVANIQDVP